MTIEVVMTNGIKQEFWCEGWFVDEDGDLFLQSTAGAERYKSVHGVIARGQWAIVIEK